MKSSADAPKVPRQMDRTLNRTLTVAAFIETMKDWPSERVFELETQMRDLVEHPAWEALMQFFANAREMGHLRLESAGVLEPAQYAQHIGWLAAISQIADVPEAVFAKARFIHEQLKEAEETVDAS
jgi:hypothetical protein